MGSPYKKKMASEPDLLRECTQSILRLQIAARLATKRLVHLGTERARGVSYLGKAPRNTITAWNRVASSCGVCTTLFPAASLPLLCRSDLSESRQKHRSWRRAAVPSQRPRLPMHVLAGAVTNPSRHIQPSTNWIIALSRCLRARARALFCVRVRACAVLRARALLFACAVRVRCARVRVRGRTRCRAPSR